MKRLAMQIERITHNPAVMGGKPCIRGLRVTVGTILGLLATGKSRERILQAYPYLVPEDIDAVLRRLSTLVRVSTNQPEILREGRISSQSIHQALNIA